MQWAGYVEKAGTGTTDIIEKCVACGLRKPEYAFDGNTVKLTIWRTGAVASPNGTVNGAVSGIVNGGVSGGVFDKETVKYSIFLDTRRVFASRR